MKLTKSFLICAVLPAVLFPSLKCRAVDQVGLVGEFSLPDRLRNLVDTQDEYYDAVQRLQDASAAVIRARESAMKEAESTPEYTAAVKTLDQSYQAFTDKKNSVVADMEKKDPVYSRMKSQVAQIDSQIEASRQNPATTQDQLEELYKNRDTFQSQWHQLEDDAIKRAGMAAVRQGWEDASRKLADLQIKLCTDIESNERLKAAEAEATAARGAVEAARTAIGTPGDSATRDLPSAADLLCKSTRASFAGNDAWWTYGWSNLSGTKPAMAAGK